MASIRAESVAEVLWELKRLEKLATYSEVAERAGFKAGSASKTIMTCLDTVRRDWPHLQWWRAVQDDGQVPAKTDQATQLAAAGYELAPVEGRQTAMRIVDFQTHIYSWSLPASEPAAT